MAKFVAKTQIAYIPTHAKGDINHKDVEYGFVTSSNDAVVFCRFWMKNTRHNVLRTKANSESCNRRDLVIYRWTSESEVEAAWKGYVESK